MPVRSRQIRNNIYGFLLLFFVSLYRQLSMRYLPDDGLRTYILYACYCLLIGAWILSIQVRVTQKSMRVYLLLEALVMLTGLSIRFIQDTFFTENVLLMRISGFCVGATLLPMVLLGFYAALGLGQADNYRLSRKWYLLLVPVLIMTYLFVTDEQRHFVCYTVPEEVQPNLAFYPYVGTFIMCGVGLVLVLARILVIFRRNRPLARNGFLRWSLPLFEPLLLLAFSFEYFAVSLQLIPSLAGKEVIELYAKLYYAEVLTWEVYIYVGLVPVNSNYRDIFEHATVGMQLLFPDDSLLLSKNAAEIPTSRLRKLHNARFLELTPGKELHVHRVTGAEFFWIKDVSSLQATIEDLNRSAEALAQEGVLLMEELKTRDQEASLQAKNRIYDVLTGEVRRELRLMREIVIQYRPGEENRDLLCQLVVLGTYVKRRCNLRLIEKDCGQVNGEDLRLSFQDMISALKLIGTPASLDWEDGCGFSAEFSIYAFDMFEQLLEAVRFSGKTVSVKAKSVSVLLQLSGGTEQIWPEMDELTPPDCCTVDQSLQDGALCVRMTEGGASYV